MSNIASESKSLEVGLFAWEEISRNQLAFPTVVWALTHFAQPGLLQILHLSGTHRRRAALLVRRGLSVVFNRSHVLQHVRCVGQREGEANGNVAELPITPGHF